jgi:hypothetical protein
MQIFIYDRIVCHEGVWEYPEVIHCPSDSVFSWSCARIVRTLGFYFTFLSSLSEFSFLMISFGFLLESYLIII